jgi:predicted small lipoprotein YifL
VIPLRRRARLGLLVLLILGVAAACGSAGPTGAPSAAVAARLPTQTETAWGRIWDAIPDAFPRPAQALPADPLGEPVSAAFSIGGAPVRVIAAMASALTAAGYSTGQSEPLEDGRVVLESTGPNAECRVQTTVTPLSGTTRMTVLFGAGCPFE